MSLPVNLREPINHGTAAAREQARAETPSETKIEKVVDLKSSPKRETINKNAALSRAQDITKPTKEAHKTIALQKEAKTQPEAKEASSASQSAAKRETLDAGNSKTRQAANPTDKKSLIRPQIFAQPAAVPTKTQPKATPIFSGPPAPSAQNFPPSPPVHPAQFHPVTFPPQQSEPLKKDTAQIRQLIKDEQQHEPFSSSSVSVTVSNQRETLRKEVDPIRQQVKQEQPQQPQPSISSVSVIVPDLREPLKKDEDQVRQQAKEEAQQQLQQASSSIFSTSTSAVLQARETIRKDVAPLRKQEKEQQQQQQASSSTFSTSTSSVSQGREPIRNDVAQARKHKKEREKTARMRQSIPYSSTSEGPSTPKINNVKTSRNVSCCTCGGFGRIATLALTIAGIASFIIGACLNIPTLIAVGAIVTLVSIPIFVVLQVADIRQRQHRLAG